jgi:FtsH-binding integral membrane protein
MLSGFILLLTSVYADKKSKPMKIAPFSALLIGFVQLVSLCFPGFSRIGLIIATIVNIFWANSTLYWITTYAGILIFAGLTAYDTQKIKNMLVAHGTEVNDSTMKLALLGSLDLYLDFINLFIYLLRIFGNKK